MVQLFAYVFKISHLPVYGSGTDEQAGRHNGQHQNRRAGERHYLIHSVHPSEILSDTGQKALLWLLPALAPAALYRLLPVRRGFFIADILRGISAVKFFVLIKSLIVSVPGCLISVQSISIAVIGCLIPIQRIFLSIPGYFIPIQRIFFPVIGYLILIQRIFLYVPGRPVPVQRRPAPVCLPGFVRSRRPIAFPFKRVYGSAVSVLVFPVRILLFFAGIRVFFHGILCPAAVLLIEVLPRIFVRGFLPGAVPVIFMLSVFRPVPGLFVRTTDQLLHQITSSLKRKRNNSVIV